MATWRAAVKQTTRTTFIEAGLLVHARSRAAAREAFAFIFDVPVRWVRARKEA